MSLLEKFASSVGPKLPAEDRLAVVLPLPWSASIEVPAGVVAPGSSFSQAGPEVAGKQAAAIAAALEGISAVLLPCTFGTEEEEQGAQVLIPTLMRRTVCVVAVLLRDRAMARTRETNRVALARCQALMLLGAADVIIDPGDSMTSLIQKVRAACTKHGENSKRVHAILEAECEKVSEEKLRDLRSKYHQALWRDVPGLLMPALPTLDQRLVESLDRVGKYSQECVLKESGQAKVWQAKAEDGMRTVVIKTCKKTDSSTIRTLESIYREFRLLSDVLAHPHIEKCLEVLHGKEGFHLIFEHIHGVSLASELSQQTGERFPISVAMKCFIQVGSAIAYCHQKRIYHRSICLEHVMAGQDGDHSRYQCVLFHFADAVSVNSMWTEAKMVISKMEYTPPEMGSGGPYSTLMADSWSLGVVLLEMAGGLGSMARVIRHGEASAANAEEIGTLKKEEVAQRVGGFFRREAAHAEALALHGGVRDALVTSYLSRLLHPDPRRRSAAGTEVNAEGQLLAH